MPLKAAQLLLVATTLKWGDISIAESLDIDSQVVIRG